jgi:D-beta-D-heptose 7-phosphate kinase/D-beta-D-heptose 1-phosphate adenosyltransferase
LGAFRIADAGFKVQGCQVSSFRFQKETKMHTKIVTAAEAAARCAGRCSVFTNGCFDLLHAGHVRYLAAARSLGDLLVVGLNSDASVGRLKGPRRPITPQAQRAEVLAALASVDLVVIFDEDDPRRLIETIRPGVLVKGADWSEANIIGADFVKAHGGRVETIALVPGASTTAIIETILDRHRH